MSYAYIAVHDNLAWHNGGGPVELDTSLGAIPTATGYGVENISDGSYHTYMSVTTAWTGTALLIRIDNTTGTDFAPPSGKMGVAFFNHNLYTAGCDRVKIYSHSTSAFGSSTLRGSVVVQADDDFLAVWDGSTDAQNYYWVVPEADVNPSVAVTIGQMIFGSVLEWNVEEIDAPDAMVMNRVIPAREEVLVTGSPYVQTWDAQYATVDVSLLGLASTAPEALNTFWHAQRGAGRPFALHTHLADAWVLGGDGPGSPTHSVEGYGPCWLCNFSGPTLSESIVKDRLSDFQVRLFRQVSYSETTP